MHCTAFLCVNSMPHRTQFHGHFGWRSSAKSDAISTVISCISVRQSCDCLPMNPVVRSCFKITHAVHYCLKVVRCYFHCFDAYLVVLSGPIWTSTLCQSDVNSFPIWTRFLTYFDVNSLFIWMQLRSFWKSFHYSGIPVDAVYL
jgi:hypothetical protein